MTMKSTPSADSISWMVTMFGWLRAEAARASCTKRHAPVLVDQALGGQDLDRDLAAEARVAGAVDLAHAPRAEGARTSYGPSRVPADERHGGSEDLSHDALLPGSFNEPFGPSPLSVRLHSSAQA